MYGKSYRTETKEHSIADAVSMAFGEFQSLGEELREWADNMENGNLGQTDKCQRVGEAADTFENYCDEPDIPEWLSGKMVTVSIGLKKGKNPYAISRMARASNGVGYLSAVSDFLDTHIGELQDIMAELTDDAKDEDPVKVGDETLTKAQLQERIDDCETLKDAVDEAKDEVDGVEIPGMYG